MPVLVVLTMFGLFVLVNRHEERQAERRHRRRVQERQIVFALAAQGPTCQWN